MLETLPSLKMISISTDIYHQIAIPLERVKNVVRAAQAGGIVYSISVCTENEEEPGYLEIMRRIQEFAPRELILTAIALPVGRAQSKLGRDRLQHNRRVPIFGLPTGSSPVISPRRHRVDWLHRRGDRSAAGPSDLPGQSTRNNAAATSSTGRRPTRFCTPTRLGAAQAAPDDPGGGVRPSPAELVYRR